MTDEIAQLLKCLHLRRIAEILDEELANADKSSLTNQELLARLLRAQWHQAQQNALEWRIERAKIPEKWTLESFPFKKQPGVSQKQMRAFAELEFVAKAENIVFIRSSLHLGVCRSPVLRNEPDGPQRRAVFRRSTACRYLKASPLARSGPPLLAKSGPRADRVPSRGFGSGCGVAI